MGATPGYNKERKAKLVKAGKVSCGLCKYHRGENRNHNQGRRNDRYKNKRG